MEVVSAGAWVDMQRCSACIWQVRTVRSGSPPMISSNSCTRSSDLSAGRREIRANRFDGMKTPAPPGLACRSRGNPAKMAALRALRDRELKASGGASIRGVLSSSHTMLHRLRLERCLEGHLGCVNTLSFSPNGELLLSGSDDLRICLWDWQTGQPQEVPLDVPRHAPEPSCHANPCRRAALQL